MSDRKKAAVHWGIFWLIVISVYIGLSLFFGDFIYYSMIPVLAAVFFIVRVILFLPFRWIKNHTARKIFHASATLISLCAAVWLCLYVITNVTNNLSLNYVNALYYGWFSPNCEISRDDSTGVYTVRATGDELRILQLSDIHICASITTTLPDRDAFAACYEIIRRAQPDLIIVTGDIVYPIPFQTFSNNNLEPFYQFCQFMENVGIPWAMVFGNHDTEALSSHKAGSLTWLFEHFSWRPDEGNGYTGSLLYSTVQPDVYGRYNNYLRIEDADGALNRLIFLIDSNDYVSGSVKINEYDSVHPDQIDWYATTIDETSREEGRLISSFVFMHIPFRAFAEASAALESGSPDAVYLFGENGEGVSHPDLDSGFFDVILHKGSTEAVFVGHDHLNNMGVNYKGVDLVYSKSIDYISYPGIAKLTGQRGGTLITLRPGSNYEITQIDYER